MPRGIDFTANEKEILRKMMKKGWARQKAEPGWENIHHRVRFNPGEKYHMRWADLNEIASKKFDPMSHIHGVYEGNIAAHYQSALDSKKEGLPNPGAAWHNDRSLNARYLESRAKGLRRADFGGQAVAHEISMYKSQELGILNPLPKKASLTGLLVIAGIIGGVIWLSKKQA